MKQKIYQVDAFSDKVFSGNPAAVCPLEHWLSDETMQQIAAENNLAETVFYVPKGDVFEIRWFTPTVEVDLCGHATLAAAFILFSVENYTETIIKFHSPRTGLLTVTKRGEMLSLNFPTDTFQEVPLTSDLTNCFNLTPIRAYKGKTDFMLVFNSEEEIIQIEPAFTEISKLNCRGIIITAKGNSTDFVSRFFAPQSGVNEDPVPGSANTTLIPYWSNQLNKIEITALQLSRRKGYLQTKFLGDRVEISGKASLYLTGEIYLG